MKETTFQPTDIVTLLRNNKEVFKGAAAKAVSILESEFHKMDFNRKEWALEGEGHWPVFSVPGWFEGVAFVKAELTAKLVHVDLSSDDSPYEKTAKVEQNYFLKHFPTFGEHALAYRAAENLEELLRLDFNDWAKKNNAENLFGDRWKVNGLVYDLVFPDYYKKCHCEHSRLIHA